MSALFRCTFAIGPVRFPGGRSALKVEKRDAQQGARRISRIMRSRHCETFRLVDFAIHRGQFAVQKNNGEQAWTRKPDSQRLSFRRSR